MAKTKSEIKKRFMRFVKKLPNGCWEWQGALRKSNKGHYGRFWFENKINFTAHRASVILFKGDFDRRLHVCHKCDYTKCVNPSHLFVGTQRENLQDARRKGRYPGRTKLDRYYVSLIRVARWLHGASVSQLAQRFKVHRSTISRIVNERSWA